MNSSTDDTLHGTTLRPSLSPRTTSLLRAAVALALGLNVAVLAMGTLQSPDRSTYTDFEFYWRAMQLWRDGIDPYAMRPGVWPTSWPLRDRLFYPLPALMIVWPLHAFAFRIAAGAFAGVAAAWLSWLLTRRREWWRLTLFCSPMFVAAVMYGQWSPLLTLGALAPSAAFLLASKPTLGLACFAYRPSWRGIVGIGLILTTSVLLWPSWPLEWYGNLSSVQHHPAPILTPFGWILLVAVIRWRQPEARLLLGMSLVPQLFAYADQLPLGLVARDRREAACIALGSTLSLVLWLWPMIAAPRLRPTTGYVMVGVYLPALWIVLRRPNRGAVPEWVERRVAHLPAWLRGRPVDTTSDSRAPALTEPARVSAAR